MIIIADSGSTKTDWVLTDNDSTATLVKSDGINPIHMTTDAIRQVLDTVFRNMQETCASATKPLDIASVHFYGSGLRPEYRPVMRELLSSHFHCPVEAVEAESDLLGAARSLCQHDAGIACILGTGANSCYYDGTGIVENTPALGYILGDEGSGAVIGRNFLNAIYKGVLPKSLQEEFEHYSGMDMAAVIRRVYSEPLANKWMASLSVFIHQHLAANPALEALVVDSFQAFFRRNVSPYHKPHLPVHAVGSIAYYYRDQLSKAASLEGLSIGKTKQTPMEGLLEYHSLK